MTDLRREWALTLQRDFCDATRLQKHPQWSALVPEIQTDQAFDAEKLDRLLREAGLAGLGCSIASGAAVDQHHGLEPAHECLLPQPQQVDHYIFERFASPQPVPALAEYCVRDGFFSFDFSRPCSPQFYVFDASGALINHLFFGSTPFLDKPIAVLDQPVVFGDDMFPAFNICHLLFDKLPRAQMAHQRHGVVDLLLANASPYVRDLCEWLGFRLVELMAWGRKGTVRLSEAWYYSNSFGRIPHPGRYGSSVYAQAFAALRDRVALGKARTTEPPARLFLQRPTDAPRSIVNQASLLPLLEKHGVAVVDPGELSFQQQLDLFMAAETLMGVHGAGLANVLWMPPGGALLELLPPLCASISYWAIAAPLQLAYHHLVCHDPEFGAVQSTGRRHDVRHNRRQVCVPSELLEQKLDQLCQ